MPSISLSTPVSDLVAAGAARGKLALVAWDAVIVLLIRDEGAGTNGLLTAAAEEAMLVPCLPVVLQLPGTYGSGGIGG